MVGEPEPGSLDRSEELRAITERFWDAQRNADVEAMIARKSRMHGLTVFGPDVDEFIDDPDHLARFVRLLFRTNPAGFTRLERPEIDAWVEGSVGWSISRVRSEGLEHELRVTLVLHLERGDWRIVHEHWSFGATQPTQETWGQPTRTLDLLAQAAVAEPPDVSESTSPDGTVTLVFTDIEGSTALNSSFGDRAWMDVLRVHNEAVKETAAEHGGTVVKGLGDGFMLAFPSARRALAFALAVNRRMRETFTDPGSPIRVRVGVHTGEVVGDGDDLLGHAVSYAARVTAAASGGEVLASSLVRDLVVPTGEFAFGPSRDVAAKGFDGPIRVHPLLEAGR